MPRNIDIRIRRGAQATISGSLGLGEPGFTTDTKKLYIGDGVSNILIGPPDSSTNDHGALIGLGDDDHPQYLNSSRGDTRYYTKTQLDSGQLDNRYYTEEETNTLSGTLNSKIVTDHGALTGKDDDDHTQYILVNGTRPFSNTVSGVYPTVPAHLATKQYVDDKTDYPVLQVRRTTNLALTTSFVPVTFDTVDIENFSEVIHRDTTNTERIYVYETGMYQIHYGLKGNPTAATTYVYGEIYLNGLTRIPGSYDFVDIYNNETHDVDNNTITSLNSGDYITLRVSRSAAGAVNLVADTSMTVIKLNSVKGDKGDTGSGSNITIKDEGLNITGTPHSTLNFIGEAIEVSDGGSGVANITVSSPVFGTYFNDAASEASSNTTSTTFQNKLTLSVTAVPAGNYRIGWYFEWNRSATTSDFIGQVQIDDSTVIMQMNVEISDNTTWHTEGGFYVASLTSGNHHIDLDYRSEVATATSYIRRARLEFWRVS